MHFIDLISERLSWTWLLHEWCYCFKKRVESGVEGLRLKDLCGCQELAGEGSFQTE
jgi:hypothetical protein